MFSWPVFLSVDGVDLFNRYFIIMMEDLVIGQPSLLNLVGQIAGTRNAQAIEVEGTHRRIYPYLV